MLHHLTASDVDATFSMLSLAREELAAGGPKRVRYTYPALAFCTLALVRRAAPQQQKDKEASGGATSCEQMLQWLLEICTVLAGERARLPRLGIRNEAVIRGKVFVACIFGIHNLVRHVLGKLQLRHSSLESNVSSAVPECHNIMHHNTRRAMHGF